MENLVKLPYEISLWDDRLTLVTEDGRELSGFVNSKEKIVDQYYKEHKLCVIGSNTMESPFGVVDPGLVRKTDGTSTLTFSMYARYYDEDSGEFKDNPFMKYLTNERKVKLKYYPNGELRWLDFIIKKIDESSENYKFTYTATDLFINELSKTGYNLEFNVELENNQGTITEMASKILARTDWAVGEDTELIQQTNEEPLYQIGPFESDWEAKDIFTDETIIIKSGTYIYTFYSVLQDNIDYFQFIYDGRVPDKDGKISHIVDENNVIQKVKNCYCARDELSNYNPIYYQGFRGKKYIRRQKTEYDKVLDKYVQVYKGVQDSTIYGYTKTDYFTPSLVTNFISNGNLILSSSGWNQEKDGSLEIEGFPSISSSKFGTERAYGIKYVQSKEHKNTYLVNSGFRDNAELIKEITSNSRFVFRIKAIDLKNEDVNIFPFSVKVCKRTQQKDGTYTEDLVLFDSKLSGIVKEIDGFYCITDLEPTCAVSYKDLTDITNPSRFYIIITADSDGEYLIQQVELFAQNTGKTKDEFEGIILPNGTIMSESEVSKEIAESYAKTTYYYYDRLETEAKDYGGKGKTKPEEIEYLFIGEEPQNEVYKPIYDSNFEKVRSISKKESNRFDLLQTLSEAFECWCRFDIWHKETGEIMLGKDFEILINSGNAFSTEKIIFLGGDAYSIEDYVFFADERKNSEVYLPYQQLKFVTFHNRIGQKKNIGFRYGTNLKSISRSLDSNTIATKLIVKSNTNEFANGGSCNIALAKENPSGENFIYDFTYYINHGLMNETNLARDLYYYKDKQGWEGLYVSLKAKNKERDNLIVELTSCTQQYARNKSNFESAKLLWNASQEELEDLKNEYFDITKDSYVDGKEIPEDFKDNKKIKGIVYNIELLTAKIQQAESDYSNAKIEMDRLNLRTENINNSLRIIEEDTATLIENFEKKYIRFIQEASWTSEDYIDDNLYYLDAETTLHKSSQPKVSYTINVIELSQLEEYKDYIFDLGDITYIQDPDFFGWKQGENFKTPHKEEIVITEMQTFFHSPEKSTIKVQNYRSSFEDLFKRLTASAQQIHFHSGEFQRAADIVDANGNIAPSCLEDAFSTNMYTLSNAANQSVKWDESGITTTDTTNPAEITRITSGGIFLTDNGGEKWTTGITAKGINAKVITTGALNTGLVTIYNGNQKSFTWDSQGINAYKPKEDGSYSLTSYVRFNHEGIIGWDGTEETFSLKDSGLKLTKGIINMDDGSNSVLIDPFGIGKVFEIKHGEKSIMSIAKDGSASFAGELIAADGKFVITDKKLNFDNTFIIEENGNAKIGNWTIEKKWGANSIIYGSLTDEEDMKTYGVGMATSNYSGDPAFWAGFSDWRHPWDNQQDGSYWWDHCNFFVKHNGEMFANSGKIGGWQISPEKLGYWSGGDNKEAVFLSQAGINAQVLAVEEVRVCRLYMTQNFAVDVQGKLYATGAVISGNITANDGYIGKFQIKNGGLQSPNFNINPEATGTDKYIQIGATKAVNYTITTTGQGKFVLNRQGSGYIATVIFQLPPTAQNIRDVVSNGTTAYIDQNKKTVTIERTISDLPLGGGDVYYCTVTYTYTASCDFGFIINGNNQLYLPDNTNRSLVERLQALENITGVY